MRLHPPEHFNVADFLQDSYIFQKWELFPGISTEGPKDVAEHMCRLQVPDRLDGLRVLDIAPWNGFFSFECARRGAKEIVSLGPDDPDTTGYSKVQKLLGIKSCTYVRASVYELSPTDHGHFDVVLCLGLLYHLRHPLLALDRVFDVASNLLFIDSPIIDGIVRDMTVTESERLAILECGRVIHKLPMIYFTKGAETGDAFNWFMPNRRAFRDFVESSGFRVDHYQDDGGWASIAATKAQRTFEVGLEGWNRNAVLPGHKG
jgi:tRNA (mo5U34)-methyltransferase